MTEKQSLHHPDPRIRRIQRMEQLYDAVRSGSYKREMVAALMEYQSGGLWQQDYEADEQGLIPAGIKRGVLSQDGLYDLLCSLNSEEAVEGQQKNPSFPE